MIYKITKNNTDFEFSEPKLNAYDVLTLKWKIIGIQENGRDPNGWFYNSELKQNSKNQYYLSFSTVKINGKDCAGVIPPDDITNELVEIHNKQIKARQEKIDQIVDDLISGEKLVPFSIVGCDFQQYSAWLNLDDDLKRKEHSILQTAIKKMYPDVFLTENVIDFLTRLAGKKIGKLETLGDNVFNPVYKTDRYQQYNDDIVTGFEMVLSDLIKPSMEKTITEQKNNTDFIAEKTELAKQTGTPQLIQSWDEDCNDPNEECNLDHCYEYVNPDGSFMIKRCHTW